MKLSEKIRGCSEGPGDFEDWAEQAAQLEDENKALMSGIRQIISTHYPVMYDDNKVGLALVALLTKEQTNA